MKQYKTPLNYNALSCLIMSICSLLFISCQKDASINSIVGAWYGVRTYYNPSGGQKYQYLTIDFYPGGTGLLQYETDDSYTAASFYYKIKGKKIYCTGARAYSDGDIDADFSMTIKIEGDRIIPEDKYSMFILTQDGSITTDSSGNEIIDNTDLLNNVWIKSDGIEVVKIEYDYYEDYGTVEPYSNRYVYYYKGDFKYNKERNTISFSGSIYDIVKIASDELIMKRQSDGIKSIFKRGTDKDIPTVIDAKGVMQFNVVWSCTSKKIYLSLDKNNNCTWVDDSDRNRPLMANGTYWITGDQLICSFTSVSWNGGNNSKYANIYPGFVYGKPCTKTFEINMISTKEFTLKSSEFGTLRFE